MAKTGGDTGLGTAERAALGRAVHSIHAKPPVLEDPWAARLLTPELRAVVGDPDFVARLSWDGVDVAPLIARNVAGLRYAEDAVERAVQDGIGQYVVLGAGFDTFALRRADLVDRLRVYEVDHPDVQALKRERVAAADAAPATLPEFVPIDFETTSLFDGLAVSSFDPTRRSVFSWMNTLPYLSAGAIRATLEDLARLSAPGSRLVLDYECDVPLDADQRAYVETVQSKAAGLGEPVESRWKPEELEALLVEHGFDVLEHATETDLRERYFEGRADGLAPVMPVRLVVAERRR